MAITIDEKKGGMDQSQCTLLSLPQCDIERPTAGVNKTGDKGVRIGKKKSIKTTAKRADLVLFELPKKKNGDSVTDLLEGRCKILANGQCASLVTPLTSLQLVKIGSSNALVVWNKKIDLDSKNDQSNVSGEYVESPTKRRKVATNSLQMVAPCRLIQPGGSGSSFLVGQPRDLDPMEISHFFTKRQFGISPDGTCTNPSISTHELCNLFQVAPNQIWEAMLCIPFVVSTYANKKSDEKEGERSEEMWKLVPEEEILFGQRALVETLCEEDDYFEKNDNDDDGVGEFSAESKKVSIESMAVYVSQRLLPLLLETASSKTEDNDKEKEHRCLAIARKTVLLSLSYCTKKKNKLNDFKRPFRPDVSRIAFYVLRDLFLKHPSYEWSNLSEQWSTRLPLGEQYERITSTTEWIEDKKIGGHGGLVPNQLVFSSSTSPLLGGGGAEAGNSSNSNDVKNPDDRKSKKNTFGNTKAVLSLVDSQSVLVWRGR